MTIRHIFLTIRHIMNNVVLSDTECFLLAGLDFLIMMCLQYPNCMRWMISINSFCVPPIIKTYLVCNPKLLEVLGVYVISSFFVHILASRTNSICEIAEARKALGYKLQKREAKEKEKIILKGCKFKHCNIRNKIIFKYLLWIMILVGCFLYGRLKV